VSDNKYFVIGFDEEKNKGVFMESFTMNVSEEEIDSYYQKLKQECEVTGYHLNPDEEMIKELIWALLLNSKRYGYPACPCRIVEGIKEKDLDIICPCEYRDSDLEEYGHCFCGLYVIEDVLSGKIKICSIPERRPEDPAKRVIHKKSVKTTLKEPGKGILPHPIWRCNVCGYLVSRNNPPMVCPICKARHDRFEGPFKI